MTAIGPKNRWRISFYFIWKEKLTIIFQIVIVWSSYLSSDENAQLHPMSTQQQQILQTSVEQIFSFSILEKKIQLIFSWKFQWSKITELCVQRPLEWNTRRIKIRDGRNCANKLVMLFHAPVKKCKLGTPDRHTLRDHRSIIITLHQRSSRNHNFTQHSTRRWLGEKK